MGPLTTLLLAAIIRAVLAHTLGLEPLLRARFPELPDEIYFWAGLLVAVVVVDLVWHGAAALARWVWGRLGR